MWLKKSTYRIILLLVFYTKGVLLLSDKRLCGDPECKEIISYARAKITYTADEKGKVSFKANSPIVVKSKSAGSDLSLWGIEVNGQSGYAPKEFILEEKVRIKDKDVTYEVPVETLKEYSKQEIDLPGPKLSPSEVILENRISATEIPATDPLNSVTEATPSSLNASESEMEAATIPLVVEDVGIVNQSLKEVVTPVINSFEVIDGTTIPIVQEIVEKVPIQDTVDDLIEQATTKQETKTTTTPEELQKTNDGSEAVKPESSVKETEPKNDNTIGAKTNVQQDETLNFVKKPTNTNKESFKPNPEELESTTFTPRIETLHSEQLQKTNDGSEAVKPESSVKENEPKNEEPIGTKINVQRDEGTSNFVEKTTNTDKESFKTIPEQLEETKTFTPGTETLHSKVFNDVSNVKTIKNNPESVETVLSANVGAPETVYEKATETIEKPEAGPLNIVLPNAGIKSNIDNPDEKTSDKILLSTKQTDFEAPNISSNMANSEDSQILIGTTETTVPLENSQAKIEILEEAKGIENQDARLLNETSPLINVDLVDGDDDLVVDDKKHFINIPSTNSQENTQKTNQDFTESGYETTPMTSNWKDKEEIVKTAQSPEIINETPTTVFVKDAEIADTQTKIVDKGHTSTATLNEDDKASSNEFVESTTLKPQLTLPIFQQPIPFPPVYENQQQLKNAGYENPNDYYREKALKDQTESSSETKTTESLPSSQIQPVAESSVPLRKENPSLNEIENVQENIPDERNDQEINKFYEPNTGEAVIEMIPSTLQTPEKNTEEFLPREEKRDAGLFTTILGTVNNFVSKLRKEPQKISYEAEVEDEELQHILYPKQFASNNHVQQDEQFCEKLSLHQCPQQQHMSSSSSSLENQQCKFDWSHINMENFDEIFLAKAFEMRELLSCLAIAASASLLFLFGYYCFCNSNREGALISKLNQLERSLLASHKENAILKDDLLKTRNKLTSIEDNSFGSNDMVVALKQELEAVSAEKKRLQEHVHSLEKELETAAEAGLELNKIVAELLNNQSGQESMIMNSVEDLQLQFNEQQKTILEINANLAEKSRENSELQLMLAEQNVRFNGEIASLQQDNDELEAEKANLQTRLEELKAEFEEDITKALEGKNVEIKRMQNEITEIKNRFEETHIKWQTSLAKIEALEDCMKSMKKDPNVNITDIINVANVKAELLDLQQQRASLKSLLETQTEARQHAEKSLKNTISEVDRLKQDFHQSEKDKLEAQTRLEVLSNYFKEKETQLQKELSLKENIWLKQQGENTSTVDRMTAMQEEIQSLKSQNDALRAEIEAQIAAHKAQTGTLENRAHETWLAARQSERRYEEARAEAAALRRRLTELGGANNPNEVNRTAIDNKMAASDLANAPSPILPPPLLDTAGSPLLGRLPPPQFMPFMGPPPPPFLNLPPPSFLSSVEMRPAPLGRMMSPPLGRYSPPAQRDRDRSDYYDDYDYDDEDDYDEDDYDYDDDEEVPRHRRHRLRSGNGSDSWRRDNYSPPPPDRSYRSHSPEDSRYNYTADRDLISTYETDLSPPSSPPERGGIGGSDSRTGNYVYSPQSPEAAPKDLSKAAKKSSKGVPNSDSDKSYNSTHHNKKGKSMV